jgi:hypothetical protein
MKNTKQTGSPSSADTDREPWEPRSVREEVGMTVFYIAERLCYRVAFLLSGVCNRSLLGAADYWRARRERLVHHRRGLREEENDAVVGGQKVRRGRHDGAKRRTRGISTS